MRAQRGVVMMAALATLATTALSADPKAASRAFETQHYLLKTDAGDDLAREAYIRLDRMFEEYAARTAGFAKAPRDKFPVYIYTKAADYRAAGATPGSSGMFIVDERGPRLLALVDAENPDGTWHTLQHEGFHQFAFTAIGDNLPTWANEGLAEYFGEALFTGDAFVSGLVPEHRRQDVVKMIGAKQYKPFGQFIAIGEKAWGDKLEMNNYDQAWAMVHFLALGDKGKYQPAFVAYMSTLARGGNAAQAWNAQFGAGGGDGSFEAAWKRYWLALPEHPTLLDYQQARVMMLTSLLAHAAASGQKFATFEKFLAAANANEIKFAPDPVRWLPPSLMIAANSRPPLDPAMFTLTWSGAVPKLVLKLRDGTTISVTYVGSRTVATVKLAPVAATTTRSSK